MFKKLLQTISSVRVAVILIAALSGLAVAATIYDLPQMYQSLPFRIFAVAFFVNLLTCSVQLWPKVYKTLKRKANTLVGHTASMRASSLNEIDLEAALKKAHFKSDVFEDENGKYILARQNVPSFFAPHVLHVGLLIILVGVFVSSFAVTGQLMLSPGESQPLPTAITEKAGEGIITVSDFETAYDDNGAVENWITTFDLSLNGEEIAKDVTTRVNHPFKQNGLSIYQMAYRNSYVVHIEGDEDFTGDYAIPEAQRFPLGNYTVDIEPMTEGVALLYIFDENNEQIASKAFKIGETINIDDNLSIEYIQPLDTTVLEFKYSYAMPIIFTGFIFAMIGSLLSLLGRYSEVNAFVARDGEVRLRIVNKSPYLRKRQEKLFGITKENKQGDEKC